MRAVTMRVHVTQDDIERPYDDGALAEDCMLARAISRAVGVPVMVGGYSDGTGWDVGLQGCAVRLALPRWVGIEGARWQEEPTLVDPFTFTLKLTHAWPLLPSDVRQVVRTYGGRAPLLHLAEAA